MAAVGVLVSEQPPPAFAFVAAALAFGHFDDLSVLVATGHLILSDPALSHSAERQRHDI